MSGFTLYYSHFTDIVDQEGHNFPLSPGLIPIVYFQNVERVYLGAPFTSCISADAVNSYEPWRKRREEESRMPLIYKESHCVTRNLMEKIASYCNCYLRWAFKLCFVLSLAILGIFENQTKLYRSY